MIPNILVSMDPSFKGLGMTIFVKSSVYFAKLFCTRTIKSFQDCLFGAQEILPQIEKVVRFVETVHGLPTKKKEFVFEIPPVGASYAAGLFMLDGFIVQKMMDMGYVATGVSCKLCRSVVGIPKAKKQIIMPDFINGYLPNLKKLSLAMLDTKRTSIRALPISPKTGEIKSHDIAESFIILLTYAYIKQWGADVFPVFGKFCSKKFEKFNLFPME